MRQRPNLNIAHKTLLGDDPRFCLLTAEGRGAIAVVRISGARAVEVVRSVFRPTGPVTWVEGSSGRLRLGRIGAGLGDEVVAVLLKTGIPAVELQCHGGTAAVALILEALNNAGAKQVQEWAIPGLDFPRGDSLAHLALIDLCQAKTVTTAEILLEQAQGALTAEVARLAELVEDDPAAGRTGLEALIENGSVGLRLLTGWKVVIAGRPNVGKSCLLNALSGFSRAIVDQVPGTTRDVVTFQTAFGGWPVELADTAGLRETDDAVENMGIERSAQELQQADLVLLVLDRSESLRPFDRQLIATIERRLVIANKADLPPAWSAGDAGLDAEEVVTVSAERGSGLDKLINTIVGRLVPNPPIPGVSVPFRGAHIEALIKARGELLNGDPAAASSRLKALIRG
jgi:tRNA modification GTPase